MPAPEASPAEPAARLRVRVAAKVREAEDIVRFDLEALDGAPLPAFSAGAHIDVRVPGGPTRSYSLCNEPARHDRYQIAVLRDAHSRGGSAALHMLVREGDVLEIGAPRNRFPLARGASHHWLLAGGIGITPLLCMAERLAHAGEPFTLHYAARSPARTAFAARIAAAPWSAQAHLHHDDGPPAQRLDIPAVVAEGARDPNAHLYVCGPAGFIDAAWSAAEAAGWALERMHRESFDDAPRAGDAAADAAFEIELASSGLVLEVPAGRTVASVLEENRIYVPTSCEQGNCGTCLTRVLGGEPDHRDHYLSDDEHAANDQFTPCVSRSRSPRLVLDL